MTDDTPQIEQPIAPPVEPAAPPAPKQEPTFDKDRLDSTLRFLDIKPEAKEYVLQKLGANDERLTRLELQLATSEAMRINGLADDDRDLIEAPTPEGIFTKAKKLAARNAALTAKSEPAPEPEPEITFPQPSVNYKNEMEAAYAKLGRVK